MDKFLETLKLDSYHLGHILIICIVTLFVYIWFNRIVSRRIKRNMSKENFDGTNVFHEPTPYLHLKKDISVTNVYIPPEVSTHFPLIDIFHIIQSDIARLPGNHDILFCGD